MEATAVDAGDGEGAVGWDETAVGIEPLLSEGDDGFVGGEGET